MLYISSGEPELQKVTPETSVRITHLHPYTHYNIYVTAYTRNEPPSNGRAYLSNVSSVTTLEDGEWGGESIRYRT